MKMFKKISLVWGMALLFFLTTAESCESTSSTDNTTAKEEQAHTEKNQAQLNRAQPAPSLTWSLERYNLSRRFLLQNDRTVQMYFYIWNEGVPTPIGYFIIDKVSSVNSQLTNPDQLVRGVGSGEGWHGQDFVLPSPAEDGSYGSNGDGVFGFTDFSGYIETNMHYTVTTFPVLQWSEVAFLGKIQTEVLGDLKSKMDRIEAGLGKPQ